MPCANCRKELTSGQGHSEPDGDLAAGQDGEALCGSDDAYAFLLQKGKSEYLETDTEESSGDKDNDAPIAISKAITVLFEASLKLNKKQVSSNSRLLMCTECLSSLTDLHGAYLKFMKLTLEGSYIQQLIETSILWPTFAIAPHRRFNSGYDDFSPLVEVKLEQTDQSNDIDIPHSNFSAGYIDDNADEDYVPEWRPPRRILTKSNKRKGKTSIVRHTRVVAKKAGNRKTTIAIGTKIKTKRKPRIKPEPTVIVMKAEGEAEAEAAEGRVSLPLKGRTVKQFPCPEVECTKSFNDEKLLRRHVKFKHGQATPEELAVRTCYQCPKPKIFGIPSQLRLHQREVHATENPFPCTKCERYFPTPNRLRIHTLLKHPTLRYSTPVSSHTATAKEPLICPHGCEPQFRSKVSLKLHLKSVHGESVSYACEICGKSFQRSTRYRRHLKYKHGQGLTLTDLEGRSCPDCSKVFETRHQLKSHQASVHSTEKLFVCEVEGCGKRFPSKNYLNIHWHMRHKREPVRYPCEQCGKSYCSKTVLQEHIDTVHFGVRNIICEVCGKACSRPSALARHMETHDSTRQKLWECKICNQRFISDRTLKSHAITHSGARDQQCTHCGDTFLHSASLRRHLHAKHGIRPAKGPDARDSPHECKQCGKTFKLKEYLSQHLRSRTHGGKGHTAQRKRELVDEEEPLDGRKYKRSSLKGHIEKREISLSEPIPTFELPQPPPQMPQPIFWAHEALMPGTSQYFRQ